MKPILIGLCIILCSLRVSAQAVPIDHIEPPFWWVGMKQPTVQIMIHGPGVGELQAQVAPGRAVRARTSRTANPNYLFVELDIPTTAAAGVVPIELQRAGRTVQRIDYELRQREPGSAERRGFGPSDAIYLVVPDRFANGDPSNDTIDGYGDAAARSDPSRRHGGDLKGLTEHLDYIAGLGFTQLWPTPVVENRQPHYSYHGYSATDLYRVDPRLGSNEDYLRLVHTARQRGMGVIMDLVPNHIGSGHWWMKDLPSSDWLNHADTYVETNHRHVTVQDRYAAQADRAGLTEGWFVPTMPDLNQRQPQLATYLVQNAIWWIEAFGLSGVRADTYPYSDKAFLARWSGSIMSEYPNFNIVGEEMTDHPSMVAYWLEGSHNRDGYMSHMPSMMDFPLHGALRQALIEPEGQGYGMGLGRLYEALVDDALYPAPERLVLFEANHDTSRLDGTLHGDEALERIALAYVATIARTPQTLYGSEIMMTSPVERNDGLVRSDFPGGWAGDPVNAFNGQGLSPSQRRMQDFVKRLYQWRKTSLAVQRGRLLHFAPDRGTYTYFRHDPSSGQLTMVVLSKATTEVRLDLSRFAEILPRGARAADVLSGAAVNLSSSLTVPPRSVTVLELAQ